MTPMPVMGPHNLFSTCLHHQATASKFCHPSRLLDFSTGLTREEDSSCSSPLAPRVLLFSSGSSLRVFSGGPCPSPQSESTQRKNTALRGGFFGPTESPRVSWSPCNKKKKNPHPRADCRLAPHYMRTKMVPLCSGMEACEMKWYIHHPHS